MCSGTLVDVAVRWQASLFDADDVPRPDDTFAGVQRLDLAHGAWVDHAPGWLRGSDQVFADLVATAPWSQREMPMYGQLVAQPRLTAWWSDASDAGARPYGDRHDGAPLPPLLADIKALLTERYGEAFDSVGCNYYRDGRDGVAWHGDRIARKLSEPLVAIVSVGERRKLLLRPREGGPSTAFALGRGDLFVMGGTCQRTWQHCVPKVAAAGPRISITFRHST